MLFLAASFGISAQDYYYTLLLGQSGDLLMPATVVQGSVKPDKDCVAASIADDQAVVRIEGRKLGSADIACRLTTGTAVNIHVHVVQSLQALVKEVKENNGGDVKWDGVYRFVRPRNDYSYCYTMHDKAERWNYAVRHFGPHFYNWDDRNSVNHHYDGDRQLHLISDKRLGGIWYTTDGDRPEDKYANLETPLAEYLEYKEVCLQERDGCDYFQLLEETFENTFMRRFRQVGRTNDKLAGHFVGYDYCCGVRCWVFEGRGFNTITYTFWVDPSNGMCLRCIYNDDQYFEVTMYNLK